MPSLATQAAAATVAAAASAFYVYRSIPPLIPPMPKSGPTRPKELLDALNNEEEIYYFGVGSNLSRTTLEKRSISGEIIKPISMEPCRILNCRLAFNLVAMIPVEPAFGSLEPLPSFFEEDIISTNKKPSQPNPQRRDSTPLITYGEKECHGALIKLSAHDYELVYQSEGGLMGPLCGYEEIMVDCIPYDKTQPTVRAVAYRVRDHKFASKDLCPSKRYMDIIRQGAAELGLSDSYQQWLKDYPVQQSWRITKQIGKYGTIFSDTLAHGFKMHHVPYIYGRLLLKVYVLPTAPRWKQITGEIASIAIMAPMACLGYVLRCLLEYGDSKPPEMRKWLQMLDEMAM